MVGGELIVAINLNPQNFTEFFTGLPLSWLAQGPVGQANGQALGYVVDNQIYQLQQAVQARFPGFAPSDAYAAISTERQLIQGWLDGYNVDPSLDGYMFPARLQAAWQQWQFAGTPLGILLQFHYQGVDGYLIQQNGLAFSLNTDIVSYSCYPANQIVLTCTAGGLLGTAVFSFSIENGSSGSITTLTNSPFTFQFPGTQTIAYFPQQNYLTNAVYVINTEGQISYWNGAIPGITQITSPLNALNVMIVGPNPIIDTTFAIDGYSNNGHPSAPIVITITTGGTLGTMEYEYLTFGTTYGPFVSEAGNGFAAVLSGTQTRAIFHAGSYTGAATYTINVDGTITVVGGPDIVNQNSIPWFTLEGDLDFWSRFIFYVDPIPEWWTDILSSPTMDSTPNITTINILRNITNTWKAAKSTSLGIYVVLENNIVGFPVETINERNARTGGHPVASTIYVY